MTKIEKENDMSKFMNILESCGGKCSGKYTDRKDCSCGKTKCDCGKDSEVQSTELKNTKKVKKDTTKPVTEAKGAKGLCKQCEIPLSKKSKDNGFCVECMTSIKESKFEKYLIEKEQLDESELADVEQHYNDYVAQIKSKGLKPLSKEEWYKKIQQEAANKGMDSVVGYIKHSASSGSQLKGKSQGIVNQAFRR